jgi:hypothetical protein
VGSASVIPAMNTNNEYKYIKYNDFWQNNFQKLDDITKTLERDFYNLEKKYVDFDSIYDGIITKIDILASIYSSLNNLHGREYLLKLKAFIIDLKKRNLYKETDFKTIHFLNSKVKELREQSYDKFPKLNHSRYLYKDLSNDVSIDINKDVQRYNKLKKSAAYKWITYYRNGSWFITPFNRIQIIRPDDADISKDNKLSIKLKNSNIKNINITDIFRNYTNGKDIKFYLAIEYNKELRSFATERLGRIIMSDRNFISSALTAFHRSHISPGRFRIFGKNHIYL